jgi:hypothetical protein
MEPDNDDTDEDTLPARKIFVPSPIIAVTVSKGANLEQLYIWGLDS